MTKSISDTVYLRSDHVPNGAFFDLYEVQGVNGTQVIYVPKNPVEALNFIWVTVCSILVLFMQAGFSLLEAGSVRVKNTKTLLFKNFFDLLVGTFAWSAVGYAVAFGRSSGGFIGTTGWFLVDMLEDSNPNTFANFFFQLAFAATAATIDSGSVSERMELGAYLICSTVICLVTYPMVVHWVWNEEGWLGRLGYTDFAGGSAVHLVGGTAGWVSAVFLGPRIGRFHPKTKQPLNIPGHSVVLQSLGTWILFIGWFAFNAGATLAMPLEELPAIGSAGAQPTGWYSNTRYTGLVLVNTLLSGVACSTVATLFTRAVFGKFDIEMMMNSLLAGLVAITSSCAYVSVGSAVAIGAITGFVFPVASRVLLHRYFVDDPLDAASVHGVAGALGTVLLGFFHREEGVFFGGDGKFFGVQVLGVLVIAAWTAAVQYLVLLAVLRVLGRIRVTKEVEETGCDCELEGGSAYSLAMDAQDLKKASQGSLVVQLSDPHKAGYPFFVKFLKEKKCVEIMELLLAIQAFEQRPTMSTNAIRSIYSEYIAEGAPRQVNLPSWARNEVEAFQNLPNRKIFDNTKREVQILLKELCDNHFVDSEHFEKFLTEDVHNVFGRQVWIPGAAKLACFNTNRRFAMSHSLTVDEVLVQTKVEDLLRSSVLLLGTGEAGKSTLMKQISILYSNNVSSNEAIAAVNGLRRNTIECMKILLKKSDEFGYRTSNPEDAARVVTVQDATISQESCVYNEQIAKSIASLWGSSFVKKTFERRHEFWLLEACEYYMENAIRFADTPNKVFSITTKDFLMSRVKTTGAHQTCFKTSETLTTPKGNTVSRTFRFIDVGGQRSERRKWLQYFDDVDTVLFLININSYHTPLFEDRSHNGLTETIDLIQEVFNGNRFREQSIIVVLNKVDLYETDYDEERLRKVFPNLPVGTGAAAAKEFIIAQFEDLFRNRGYSAVTVVSMSASESGEVAKVIPLLEESRNHAHDEELIKLVDSKAFKPSENMGIQAARRRHSTDTIRRRLPGVKHNFLGEPFKKDEEEAPERRSSFIAKIMSGGTEKQAINE